MQPAQGWEIVMHGGEFYDSQHDKMYCKSDVFVYSVAKDQWRHLLIPNRYLSACSCVTLPLSPLLILGRRAAPRHAAHTRWSSTKASSTCGVAS